MNLVLGVDAGGTATRAVVATTTGTIVGRGRGGPGNPLSAGPGPAAAAVTAAVRRALDGRPPAAVAAAVLGIAGTSALADPATAAPFAAAWAQLGLACRMDVVGDAVTAFAAGSTAPGGAVLIAGTGAIAALVADRTVVRTVDGLGWLLGDAGSGRWIGLQALRAAVRDWSSPLAAKVAAQTGAGSADDLIRWAQALPLDRIGALAPVICAAARHGDPAARAIVAEAVRHLHATLTGLRAEPGTPVVLAGGLLVEDTPVRAGMLAALWTTGTAVGTARDPAAAAAHLAAAALRDGDERGAMRVQPG
jgi:N-acetylglucosamine kinase-like BadF-type ATPase